MLEVCFDYSVCGKLKAFLNKSDVLYSYTTLEVGKINKHDFNKSRKKNIRDFYAGCSRWKCLKIFKKEKKQFEKIVKSVNRDKEIRIWCDNTSSSKCGLYHLVFNLKDIDCKVYLITVNNLFDEVFEQCLSKQREITEKEKKEIAYKWSILVEENSNLRLNIDNEINSVSESYLDEEILKYAPEGEYRLAQHISSFLKNCKYIVPLFFIENRIEHFIETKKIEVIQRSKKDNYDTILKKC